MYYRQVDWIWNSIIIWNEVYHLILIRSKILLIDVVVTKRFALPPRYEYHWADGTTVKKPIKCSAPKYIEFLMQWVQEQLDDETIFPSKIGMFVVVFIYCFVIVFIYCFCCFYSLFLLFHIP